MSNGQFTDQSPLGAARGWLRSQAAGEGARCPCCTQFARVYRRALTAPMAAGLIRVYRQAGREWFHLPTVLERIAGDHAKLRYWRLIEESDEVTPEHGRTAGWWRVTELGEQFVRCEVDVPRHALVYDSRLLRLDAAQGRVTIRTALGKRFDYSALMGELALVDPGFEEAG